MMDAILDWEVPPLAIVADKAYASTKIRQQIADEGALAGQPLILELMAGLTVFTLLSGT